MSKVCMKWICHVFFLLCLGFASQARAVTYLTQEQALALAFQDPSTTKQHELIFDEAHRQLIEKKLGESVPQRGVLAYTGKLKSGEEHGVVIFDAVIGKHEAIDYMVVLDGDGKVKFIEVLVYRESYGGEIRRESWRKQFKEKSEKDLPEHEKNIVNISGATLSCRHVTNGVRKLLAVAGVYAGELGLKTQKIE